MDPPKKRKEKEKEKGKMMMMMMVMMDSWSGSLLDTTYICAVPFRHSLLLLQLQMQWLP